MLGSVGPMPVVFWGLFLKKSTGLRGKSFFQKGDGRHVARVQQIPVSRMNYFGVGAKM